MPTVFTCLTRLLFWFSVFSGIKDLRTGVGSPHGRAQHVASSSLVPGLFASLKILVTSTPRALSTQHSCFALGITLSRLLRLYAIHPCILIVIASRHFLPNSPFFRVCACASLHLQVIHHCTTDHNPTYPYDRFMVVLFRCGL